MSTKFLGCGLIGKSPTFDVGLWEFEPSQPRISLLYSLYYKFGAKSLN